MTSRRRSKASSLGTVLPLLPGESITSWFVRLARVNAFSLHELASTLLGYSTHSVTGLDLDALPSTALPVALARGSGVPIEDVYLAGLASWQTLLSGEPSPGRRWILAPSRTPGKARKGRWTQACFACLADDGVPYFRLYWRFAFITECPVHRLPLHDVCPHCGNPLDFPQMDRGFPRPQRYWALSRCPHCCVDWRLFGQRTSRGDPRVGHLQRDLLKGLASRWVYHRTGAIWVGVTLDGLFRLLRCFRAGEGRKVAERLAGSSIRSPSGEPFERWSIEHRRALLRAVAVAWFDWPRTFVDAARREGLTATVLREKSPPPWWLERVVIDHLDRSWYAPSSDEAASAGEVLSRHGVSVTPWVLREWLGCYVPKPKLGGRQEIGAPQQLALWPRQNAAREDLRRAFVSRLVITLRRYCAGAKRRPGNAYAQLPLNPH